MAVQDINNAYKLMFYKIKKLLNVFELFITNKKF